MTRRMVVLLVATALAVTLVPPPANAGERPNASVPKPVTALEDAARMLEPYLSGGRNGAATIDAPAAVLAAIDPAVLAQLEQSAVLAPARGKPTVVDPWVIEQPMHRDPWCRGRSGLSKRWWGYRMYLDSCQTNQLVRLLSIGAGAISLICPALGLPAGLACAAVSGAFYVLANVIGYITGARYGIYISSCWACFFPVIRRQ